MPQTWLVVQCFKCQAFQVDQEKKAKKWACKLCGERQSLQRVFARSHSAKDCRLVVQQYNTVRGALEAEDTQQALEAAAAGDWAHKEEDGWAEQQQGGDAGDRQPQQQRWLEFQDDEDTDGCTVALPPERPAPRAKRGDGGGGGGGKRQRRAQPQGQEAELDARWGAGGGSGAGWQAADPQPQRGPFANQNSGAQQQPRPGSQPAWTQQPQPACIPRGAAPQQHPQQPPLQQQRAPPSNAQAHAWQAQAHAHSAVQQQRPAGPTAAGRWGVHGAMQQQQQQQQQQPRAAAGKWGGFAAEDDDW